MTLEIAQRGMTRIENFEGATGLFAGNCQQSLGEAETTFVESFADNDTVNAANGGFQSFQVFD